MEYITTKEASEKWGVSAIRITVLANNGRIPGAKKMGKIWMIPACASKPSARSAGRPSSAVKKAEDFFFPLYHFRPDWSNTMGAQLLGEQKSLLLAETAVLECRFSDAWPLLEGILRSPDDIGTEIGCLWNAAICCIALNKPAEFSRIFLRLQILLSEDFPHQEDYLIILDYIKTYVDTINYTANNYTFNTDVHDQSIPLTYVMIGYVQLIRESINQDMANTDFLKLGLRFLKTTGSIIAMEMMNIYLMGIYFIRQNMEEAEKYAKAAVQIAYENKLYFPLVTFYPYYSRVLSPLLNQYPKDFQENCHRMISQYKENFTLFLLHISENSSYSRLNEADLSYAFGVLMGLSNTDIADRLGVSIHTVKRRISRIRDKLGITSKKDLFEHLHSYM